MDGTEYLEFVPPKSHAGQARILIFPGQEIRVANLAASASPRET